ncbi:MAG: DUF2892 domain-containing protein [Lentimicrobiaceae bacterium]|nr:DUF2892 domain-containing protein [Lentimicrobiaceae bacterium]
MKKNIGNTDKTIRLLIALIIFVVLLYSDILASKTGIVLIILAIIIAITALAGYSLIYRIFKINTVKKRRK